MNISRKERMRKYWIGLCTLLLLTSGCANNSSSVSDEVRETITSDIPVDLDLTYFSNTVLLSEMNNMIVNPDDYQDKVIRLAGTFSIKQDIQTGKKIFNCEITDATGCCPSGTIIEIFPKEDFVNVPKIGTNIIVQGTMNYAVSDYFMNMQLQDAEIWLNTN